MDETALHRRLDAMTPEPADSALDAARRTLERRITEADGRATGRPGIVHRTRRLVVAGVGVAAAGTAAVAVVVGLGPTPTASAEVTRTLRGAAEAVAARSVPTEGYREHQERRISSATRHGAQLVIDTSVLVESEVTLRRADESGVWERVHSRLTPIGAWGPARARALADLAEDDTHVVERSDEDATFWEQESIEVSPQTIAATPQEPGALLTDLSAPTDSDSTLQRRAERAIDKAGDLLGSGLADADLQAAVYRALEQLPGLVVDRHARDIDGRPGVGIGVVTSGGRQRIDLIIDPGTGRYLGRTETDLTPFAGAPAGTIEEGTAVYPG